MMRIHITVRCQGITDPDSDCADWAVAEVSDVLERSGLDAGGYKWSIDDATVEGGAA